MSDTRPRIIELRVKRSRAHEQMKRIIDAAEKAGKDFTVSQQADWDRMQAEVGDLTAEIDRREAEEAESRARERFVPTGNHWEAQDDEGEVLLRPEQRMAEYVVERGLASPAEGRLHFGRWARGLATGDWSGADLERRAMGEATVGAGGALVPTLLAAEVIDRARAQSVALRAGVRTKPMGSDKVDIARVSGDPTANWLAENTGATESDLTMERVTLDSQALVVGPVRASLQLVQDADNLDDLLRSVFADVLALKLDLGILRGSGTAPEIRGIRNQTGVTIQTTGTNGSTASWDHVLDAMATVRTNNREPNALVWHPRTPQTLSKTKDTTGQYLPPPPEVAGLGKFASTQVPINLTVGTSTDTSDVYVADWADGILGLRTDFQLVVLQERYMDVLEVGFIGYMRADFQLAQAASFVVVTGVRP